MENKRLTWDEIVKKYPDRWVGLTDVDWNGADVRSAIVKCNDKDGNAVLWKQVHGEVACSRYTTPENLIWNLASGVINYAS